MFLFSHNLEDTVEIFQPLRLERKQTVFLPVNDNTNKHIAGGGSHWALLVYSRLPSGEEGVSGNQFTYIDSAGGDMIGTVEKIASKMAMGIDAMRAGLTEEKEFARFEKEWKDAPAVMQYFAGPRQHNSYDCGMFVLATTEALLEYLCTQKPGSSDPPLRIDMELEPKVLENVNQAAVTKKRKQILELIHELIEERKAGGAS